MLWLWCLVEVFRVWFIDEILILSQKYIHQQLCHYWKLMLNPNFIGGIQYLNMVRDNSWFMKQFLDKVD